MGATAVLAGLFDGTLENEEKHLKRFTTISNQLSKEEKSFLAKQILLNHYNMFEIYEYYFKKHPEIKSDDAVIIMPLMKVIGYVMMMNKETIQTMNYFKTKTDLYSKINVAIGNLRLASAYIKLGAISPFLGTAISEIEKAKKVLDDVNYKNLVHLKNNVNAKLLILKDVYEYQNKIHELKRAKNKSY